jgi:hypothetical protein
MFSISREYNRSKSELDEYTGWGEDEEYKDDPGNEPAEAEEAPNKRASPHGKERSVSPL